MKEPTIKKYILEDAVCPVCNKGPVIVTETNYVIPNFGKTLLTMTLCKRCGFRRSDVMSLEFHEPSQYEMRIENSQDLLLTRVLRSSTATIKIPELGIKISPGPKAEGFISNVEGVLERIVDKTKIIRNQMKSKEFNAKLEAAKRAEFVFTIIITDPLGNSAIISDRPGKVKRRKIKRNKK